MITFFVSSTFNDMQAERDLLHQVVEPKVRKEAAKYGESVRLLDLRWGVNTEGQSEEESSKKVLDVCLSKIDECDGYIVGMLGNRYGWIPDYTQIPGIETYGVSFSDPISVTELEMKYGILDRNEGERAILFFRDSVNGLTEEMKPVFYDQEENPKLSRLKEKLSGLKQITTRHYSLSYREEDNSYEGLEEFGDMLQVCLCEKIAKICEKRQATTKIEQIRSRFDAYIEERSQNYLPVPFIENEFENYCKEGFRVFLLVGKEGQGKTSFSAHFCKENEKKYTIVSFFTEAAEDGSVDHILEYFIERTAELVGDNVSEMPEHPDEKRFLFSELLKRLDKPVFYVIDSLEHFEKEDALKFLPKETEESFAHFIITSEPNNRAAGALIDLRAAYRVSIPDVQNMGDFVWSLITSMGKEIPKEILKNALKDKGNGSYLYGKMVMNLLSMIDRNDFKEMNQAGGNIEAINRYLGKKLEDMPPSLEAMGLYFLYESGQKLAPEISENLMKLWAVCPEGLRAQDYEALLKKKWVENDFQKLEYFLDDIYKQGEDGSYHFIYRPILEASKLLYEEEVSEGVYGYLRSLPDDDPIKKLRFPVLGMKHREYEMVCRLILSDRDNNGFVHVMKSNIKAYSAHLPSMFKNQAFLEWYLEKVAEELAAEGTGYHLYQALRSSAVPGAAVLRMKYYEAIAVYGNAPEYYRDALAAAIESGQKKDIARLHLKVAENSRANSREELEEVKDHLKVAMELADSKSCEAAEAKLWFQVIQMTYRFGTNGFLELLSLNRQKRGERYLDVIARIVFRKHMMIEMDEAYYEGVRLVISSLREMKTILENETAIEDKREFFELLKRFTEYASISEEKTECIEVLEEQGEVLRKRLLSSMEWDTMNVLALTCLGLSELYSDMDEEKSMWALSEACRIWIHMMIPGEVFECAEMLGESIRKLFKLQVKHTEGTEIPEDITELADIYKVVMTAYYDQKVEEAYEEAKKYPDEIHEEKLENAREKLAVLNYDCRCMKNIPWDFCYYEGWEGIFHMVASSDGKISDLQDIYSIALIMFKRYERVEEKLLSESEDRTVELTFIYQNIYQLLNVALFRTDAVFTSEQETDLVKMIIQVLKKWLLITESENLRIGILYGLSKMYLKYAFTENVSDEERLEAVSKKNTVLGFLRKKDIPEQGIYTGRIFGTITEEKIEEI